MVSINSLKRGIGSPTGTISVWSREIISNDPSLDDNLEYLPSGYLRCDGSVLKDYDYPFLASILGVGDSSKYKKENTDLENDEFQLPDLGSKKILGHTSISNNRYVNLYTESGEVRTGILQRVVNTLEGEYNLRFLGRFSFPVQFEEFFGRPKVIKEDGLFVESEEVLENQIIPHGHYHSGNRTRVLNQRDGSVTSPIQRNYNSYRSNVEIEEWQDNTYQLACDYKFNNKSFMGVTGLPHTISCEYFTPNPFSGFTRSARGQCRGVPGDAYNSLPEIAPDPNYCIITQKTVAARGGFPYTPKYRYEASYTRGDSCSYVTAFDNKGRYVDIFSSRPRRFSDFLGGNSDRLVSYRVQHSGECWCIECVLTTNYPQIEKNLASINAGSISGSSSYGGLENVLGAFDPNKDLVTRTHTSHQRSYNIVSIYHTKNSAGRDRICANISGSVVGSGPYRAEYNFSSSVSSCSGRGSGDFRIFTDGRSIPADWPRSSSAGTCFPLSNTSSCQNLRATERNPESATGILTIINLIAVPRITINGVRDIDVGDTLNLSLSFSGGAHYTGYTVTWSCPEGSFSPSMSTDSTTTFTATVSGSRVRIRATITFKSETDLLPDATETKFSSYFVIRGSPPPDPPDPPDPPGPEYPPGYEEGKIVGSPPPSRPPINLSNLTRRNYNLHTIPSGVAATLPFDIDSPLEGSSYTSVRNIIVDSDIASKNNFHKHLMNSKTEYGDVGNEFELKVDGNTIEASPLQGICNINSIASSKLDQYVQPFIVQEYIIKF